jgi:hypothetical protein
VKMKLISRGPVCLMFTLFVAMTGAALAQNPVPLIDQPLVPDAAAPGGPQLMLTVNGTGFVSGSVVHWNGSPLATTFVSGSELKGSVPASDVLQPGTASVTVVNPGPGGGTSNVVYFAVGHPTSSVSLRTNSYTAGSGSLDSLAIGDFNGDGKADLAMTDANGQNVSVLLSNGDGTFRPPVTYATGIAEAVVTGDFNGDGKLDLAVAYSNGANVSGGVAILLGNGDGTFRAAVNYGAGLEPGAIAVGDFNGDGKLDVVVANYAGGDISVLLGNGDGTFKPAVTYSTGSGSLPLSLAVGDFNHDGKLDVVVGKFSCYSPCGTISVFLGNGDGTFPPAVNYNGGGEPISIAAGDFNGDGRLDLAVADISSGQVLVLKGNGDGTFQGPVSYGTTGDPDWIALGDLNGDGKLDLAVLSATSSCRVNVLLGNGDGTFQPEVNYSMPSCNSGLAGGGVGIADFNRDGKLDLAVAAPGSSTFSVLLQTPTGSLSPTSLTFAAHVVGTRSSAQQVSLTNTGPLELSIAGISISGKNAPDFSEANNCPSTLAIGAMCTIDVTFAPTQVGPRSASVTITDNAAASPQQIALSGIGVMSGPNATLSPASIAFGTQLVNTTSPAQSVTLTNNGTAMLAIASIATTGDFGQTNTCGSSLAILASCTIAVTFAPKQQGNRTGTLSVKDNAPGSPQTVSLSGTGTVGVQLNPNSLNFGGHRVGAAHTLSTTLTTSSALSIASIAITGADTDEFSETNTCGASVAAGKSCTITVTYRPKEVGGDSAAVSITDNGPGSPQSVTLGGWGCNPLQRCN